VTTEKNCAQYGELLDHRTEEHVLEEQCLQGRYTGRLVKNYRCFEKCDVSIFSVKELRKMKYSKIQGQRKRMPIGERTHSLVDVRPRLGSSKLLVMQ